MRSYLQKFLILLLTVILLVAGVVLVGTTSYISYQNTLDLTINHHISILGGLKNTLYNPSLYHQVVGMLPALPRIFVEEIAASPEVLFMRTIQPDTNRVSVSNISEEIGESFDNAPPFIDEPYIRRGTWNGKKVLEISMRGVATENLWIGIDLDLIQGMAIRQALIVALFVMVIVFFLILILHAIISKFIIKPIIILNEGIQKVKKGDMDISLLAPTGIRTELVDLVDAFNGMVKTVKKSKQSIEMSNEILEEKVKTRTKELEELNETLEDRIKERTKEMEKRIKEMEQFHKLSVGRELKMIELKKENERLKKSPEKPNN